MAKPIVSNIESFDAVNNMTVTFTYSGNQVYKNRLVVTRARNSEIVYDSTITSFKLNHTIPANTLENNTQYYAQIQCFDSNDKESSLSIPMYFYCIKTPEFYFQGIKDNDNIGSSSLELQLYYDQDNEEPLKDYQYFLYDSGKVEILKSDIYYSGDLSYRLTGLEDEKIYYIRAKGDTRNALAIDTGLIKINIKYTIPPVSSLLKVNCDKQRGYMTYTTNLHIIHVDNPDDYTYENDMINLIGKELTYDYGFNISGDFEVKLKGTHLNRDGLIFEMSNGLYTISLSSTIYNSDGEQRFKLSVKNPIKTYVKYSDVFYLNEKDNIEFCIRRKNDFYKLVVYRIVGESVNLGENSEFYYGYRIPYFPKDKAIFIDEEKNNDGTDTENVKVDVKSRTITFSGWNDEPQNQKDGDLWIREY